MDKPLLHAIEQNLPTLPQVALQVMQLAEDPETDVSELERLISRDPAIASNALRLVNSVFFALRGTVSTLKNAIVTLGFRNVQSLVVAAACKSLHREDSPQEQLMWNHALAVSVAARILAAECGYCRVEEATTGGLLHDIGKLVMNQHLGEEYKEVMDLVENEGRTFVEVEQDAIGFTHADVGGMAVHKWNFSPSLEEAVSLHHNPKSAQADPELCAIVSLANNICVKLGIGLEWFPHLELSETDPVEILNLDGKHVSRLLETVVSEMGRIPSLRKFVSPPSGSEQDP